MIPQFSVIIPTRNREAFLAEAVESVLRQEDATFEILVVNDGLPLGVSFIDQRVRVLDNHMRTAVPARNLGVSQAQSAFIAFLDDDDYFIDPSHLAKAALALNAGADFYFANGEMTYPDGSRKLFDYDASLKSLKENNTILVSAICYSRALHASLGLFDETIPYYWDWDWYLRVASAGFKLQHQSVPAVAIRVHANNMSTHNVAERRANLDVLECKHGLGKIPLKAHVDFVA